MKANKYYKTMFAICSESKIEARTRYHCAIKLNNSRDNNLMHGIITVINNQHKSMSELSLLNKINSQRLIKN